MSWAPDRAPERGMGYGVGQPYGGAPGRGAYAAAPRRDEIEELTGPERFASATSFRKRDPMDVNPHRRCLPSPAALCVTSRAAQHRMCRLSITEARRPRRSWPLRPRAFEMRRQQRPPPTPAAALAPAGTRACIGT